MKWRADQSDEDNARQLKFNRNRRASRSEVSADSRKISSRETRKSLLDQWTGLRAVISGTPQHLWKVRRSSSRSPHYWASAGARSRRKNVGRGRTGVDFGRKFELAARSATARPAEGRPRGGVERSETAASEIMAEREGFEPPIRLPVCRISSAVHSTTLPPLQVTEPLAFGSAGGRGQPHLCPRPSAVR